MVDDGRTTDGRTTEHGYTISSPCEPDGSGELKTSKNAFLGYGRRAHIPLDSFDKFHKQKSCPFAVLPVCMQEFLILILQLPFSNFWGFYVPLYCFVIEQLAQYIQFLGTKQTVQAKQRKVGALFGTVLKHKQSAPNKALTLCCFPRTICFVPINLLFWTSCSILTHYNGT